MTLAAQLEALLAKATPGVMTAVKPAAAHAVKGPNNLLRHTTDGHHCVGHGIGTWDYIIGDFS